MHSHEVYAVTRAVTLGLPVRSEQVGGSHEVSTQESEQKTSLRETSVATYSDCRSSPMEGQEESTPIIRLTSQRDPKSTIITCLAPKMSFKLIGGLLLLLLIMFTTSYLHHNFTLSTSGGYMEVKNTFKLRNSLLRGTEPPRAL